MCEHLAHIVQTLHWASGSKLCHHTLLCGIIPPFWHGIFSLLGCQYSPPPSVVGSAMLHPRHHPLFVSLRFSLARRQWPFLGTKYWREPHKRTNLSLFPHSRPPYSADHHGPTPTCNGYFFVPSFTKISVCSAPGHLTTRIFNKLNVYHSKTSCSRHLCLNDRVSDMFDWRSWIYNTIPVLYSASSHFPIIGSLGIDCESQTITSGYKKKRKRKEKREAFALVLGSLVFNSSIDLAKKVNAQSRTGYLETIKVRMTCLHASLAWCILLVNYNFCLKLW